jgi:hypothetical protein
LDGPIIILLINESFGKKNPGFLLLLLYNFFRDAFFFLVILFVKNQLTCYEEDFIRFSIPADDCWCSGTNNRVKECHAKLNQGKFRICGYAIPLYDDTDSARQATAILRFKK